MSAPGWYADPANPQMQRWWDGTQWSPATQSVSWGPSPATDLERVESDGRRAWTWLWVGIALYACQFVVSAISQRELLAPYLEPLPVDRP